MNNFHRFFGKFLICFRKFDWKSDTHHSFLEFVAKSWQNFIKNSQKNAKFERKNEKIGNSIFSFAKNVDDFGLKFWDLSGAKVCKSCRSRQELSNEYLLAKIGVDTAENEPLKVGRPPPIRTRKFLHTPAARGQRCTQRQNLEDSYLVFSDGEGIRPTISHRKRITSLRRFASERCVLLV